MVALCDLCCSALSGGGDVIGGDAGVIEGVSRAQS